MKFRFSVKCAQATSVMQQRQAARGNAASRALMDEAGIQVLPSASHPPVPSPAAVPFQRGWQEGAATRSPPRTAWHLRALPPPAAMAKGPAGAWHTFPSAEPAVRWHRPSQGRAGSSCLGTLLGSANACPGPKRLLHRPPSPFHCLGVGFGPKSQTAVSGSALRSPSWAGRGPGSRGCVGPCAQGRWQESRQDTAALCETAPLCGAGAQRRA